MSQAKHGHGGLEDMGSHITDHSCSVIPPSSPVERCYNKTTIINSCGIIPCLSSSLPQIPVERRWRCTCFFGPFHCALWPYWSVCITVHVSDIAYYSSLIPFSHLSYPVV